MYNIAAVYLNTLENRTGAFTSFDFKGRLTGLLTDFVVNGNLNGDFGDLYLDLLINSSDYKRGVILSGIADIKNLELGKLSGIEELGACTLFAKANVSIKEGGIKNMQAFIDTLSLSRLEFNHYVFKDFKMLGEFKNSVFDGRISAADPNLHFLFQGRTDLSRSTGAAANFFANIAYADLTRLNLYKSDSSAVLSGLIQADFSHINNKGDIDGTLYASGLTLHNKTGTHTLEHFFLESIMEEDGSSKVTVDSDAFTAAYEGTDGLMSYLTGLVNKRFALFRNSDSMQQLLPAKGSPMATLHLAVNNSAFLEELLMPGLYVSPGTEITLIDFGHDSLSSVINAPRLGYKEHNLKDLNLLARADKRDLRIDVTCKEMALGPLKADTVRLTSTAFDNKIVSELYYSHKKNIGTVPIYVPVVFYTSTQKDPVIKTWLTSDNLYKWQALDFANRQPGLSGKTIALHNMLLQHEEMHKEPEYLLVHGILSPVPSDTLFVELSKFDAALFNTLMPPQYPFTFKGAFTEKDISHISIMTGIFPSIFWVNNFLSTIHWPEI